MRLYELILETGAHHESELIQKVKDLFDKGLTYPLIADQLGLSINQVRGIIGIHHEDRERRLEDWSPEEIELLKKLYDQGLEFKDIGMKLGRSKKSINWAIIEFYPDRKQRHRRPTLDEKIRMGELYATGMTLKEIGKIFDCSLGSIPRMIKILPNFNELLQKRLAVIDAHKEAARLAAATTKISRAGEIGNDRLNSTVGKNIRGRMVKQFK